MTKTNVESFNLDHIRVAAPFIKLTGTMGGLNGDIIHKYDIHFRQSNKEHIDMFGLHSLEHLATENIRDHSNRVVGLSPMGYQAGFYVSSISHDNYNDILNIVRATLNNVLNATEVPACNEVQRGWAASHSLGGAKTIAQAFLGKRNEWYDVSGIGK